MRDEPSDEVVHFLDHLLDLGLDVSLDRVLGLGLLRSCALREREPVEHFFHPRAAARAPPFFCFQSWEPGTV